ncbi:MAG: translocation/assembly module TamB domain-containing protein [Chitinophagaceae bacterium]|nr:translocation/assembly module TamB domain-containing protein [Chitinophagaceae bacterium]
MPLLVKQPKLEGLLTGTATLKDPFGRQEFSFTGDIQSLLFENNPVGNISLTADVNPSTGIIGFTAAADNEFAKFNVNGKYNLKDSVNNQMDIDLTADKIALNTLEPYLGSIFGNINGTGIGYLKLSGTKKHILLTGSVTVTEASLKVLYTQCTYLIKNETIIFNPDEIDLGSITLTDKYGNKGLATGKLYHNFFKDFEFDNINVSTNKLLLLNTTKKDNTQFYGRVIGSASMNINGPVTDMRMNINGKPSSRENDSSHIYIPSSNNREVGSIDYIEFIQFGSKMENERLTKPGTAILVDMNIETNPACKIDVILDESTGDIIKAVGYGNLNIRVGNKEPLTIRGKYEIERGEYTFNFQQFVEKGFTIKRGGYISWDKPDPFDATINIEAEYSAKDVDFSSFPSLKGYRAKSDVDVVAHLTNTLKSPEISFEFVLPGNSPYAQDNFVQSKLEDFTRDKNEMNKQISSVLIFNTFVQQNQGFLQNQNAISIGINTIGQILSRSLTDYVNKYLQKIGLTFDFDVSSSNDLNGLSESYSQLQAAANFAFSKQWFKGRLIVTVGGNVDVNNPYTLTNKNTNSSLLLTPDFSAEWLLSQDGKVRVIGFRRSNIDFSVGQRNRQGLSLNYRTDFDRVSDIFKPSNTTPLRKNTLPVELIKPARDTLKVIKDTLR